MPPSREQREPAPDDHQVDHAPWMENMTEVRLGADRHQLGIVAARNGGHAKRCSGSDWTGPIPGGGTCWRSIQSEGIVRDMIQIIDFAGALSVQ